MPTSFRHFLCAALMLLALLPAGRAQEYSAYLFAYFEGKGDRTRREQLRFAVSEDAVNWYALNDNEPIIESEAISRSGGIRDPHILRGEDGRFYIVATDMSTARNGWKENPGIVLLRSDDLLTWEHHYIVLAEAYPEHFGDAYWVWAPQCIWDRQAGKYMIYFTLRRGDDPGLVTYYSYANADFSGFEGEPKVLFNAKYGSIDNDIIYHKGKYHLFYKGNTKDAEGQEIRNGIQQAVSSRLTGGWKEDFKYLDPYVGTNTHVEGSSVFKLNGREEYVLMYDVYNSGRYEYQTSKDLVHFTSEPQSFNKDFNPRHGSVISLTEEELDRVQERWGRVLTTKYISRGNPLFRHKFTADPAPVVFGDELWLYTSHDLGREGRPNLIDWCVFSTRDLSHWTEYPCPLRLSDFTWIDPQKAQAYAGQCIERNGKYYWYISTDACGIGVAVSDRPQGPFKDALGRPLLTNADCFASSHEWACIDPSVMIDDDGQAYLFWGNGQCYWVRLKENMVETEGEIHQVTFPPQITYTEGPWVHKHGGKYYLTFACDFPEKIAYALADRITGPYVFQDVISYVAGNSSTTHPGIVEFQGRQLFFTHDGALPQGGPRAHSITLEELKYNPDGTIRRILPTAEGITP